MSAARIRQAAHPPLLERERELDALKRALDRACEGAGSFLLVEGPAGIGKTRLLAEARELARERKLFVRSVRGGELEREMPFGLARQLFEPTVERASEEERSRLLSGSAELALIALGRADREGSGIEGDPLAPIHGLYWLLANLAESQQLLVAIDDIHWADAETLRFLDYLSRRMAELPVVVLAAARSGEPDEPAALNPLRHEAEVLMPGPLSLNAIRELVEAELGAESSADLSEACSSATIGNPFLLTEVFRALRADALDPEGDAAATIAALGPESVARKVFTRLGRFGSEAVSLARAIAVLGGSPQLRHAARVAGLEKDCAQKLLDRLREAEILTPGLPVEFVHPLVRGAIYRDLSDGERSHAHRRAADALLSTGHGAREVAPHLMACTPNGDQAVVARLREAADEAVAAGAYDSARPYLERALEEPPEDQVAVRYELAKVLLEVDPVEGAEAFANAVGALEYVAERASDAELRVAALWRIALAYAMGADTAEAVRRTARALDAVPEDDLDLERMLEAHLYLYTASLSRDESASERIRQAAATAGKRTDGERMARQARAFDLFADCGPVDEVVELAALFPSHMTDFRDGQVMAPALGGKILAWSGRWDAAHDAFTRMAEQMRQSGRIVGLSFALAFLAEVHRLSGRLTDAETEASAAWEIAQARGEFTMFGWFASMNRLAALIARGEVKRATAMADGMYLDAGPGEVPANPWPRELRGYLRIAQGQLEGGVDDLLAVGEALEGIGLSNPALAPWRQEAAPALAALDRTAEAEELIAVAEERARSFGAPHVTGGVLRSSGLIEPRERQLGTLRESVAALELNGPPHELARSLVELGAALRRGGSRSEAREPLRRGLDLAARAGAGGTEARAREELTAAGSRPRSAFRTGVASLTASELRTAKLAAEGLNNREIAERLFVTRRTIETHLTHAYQKLDIEGRDQLAAALTESRPQAV